MIHLELTQDEFDRILDALKWAEDDRRECAKYADDDEDAASCESAADKLMILSAKLKTMEEK